MGLHEVRTAYQGEVYTGLITRRVESPAEVVLLAKSEHGGTYFFGGVLDSGSGMYVFFGQGPNHDIFAKTMRRAISVRGEVFTCQINIDRATSKVEGILFLNDPGEKKAGLPLAQVDQDSIKRRRSRILAVIKKLSHDVCHTSIDIGWSKRSKCWNEYEYLTQINLLKRVKKY